MARHGTQGKIVKHITISVTQPDATQVSEKIAIRMSSEGRFRIDLPKHVADFFGPREPWEHQSDHKQYYRGEISAMTLKTVEEALGGALTRYRNEMKNALRQKMIVVSFRANFRGPVMLHGMTMGHNSLSKIADLSFAGSPALGLSYEILWHINDGLYRVYADKEDGSPPQMIYMKSMPKGDGPGKRETFVLPWTEEREAFFKNGVEGLNTLIARVAAMLLGGTETVDKLIAGGGMLSLPAHVPPAAKSSGLPDDKQGS